MIFKKKIHLDHTKKYWDDVAKNNVAIVMEKICHNYTPDDFENKKESIIFDFDIKFDKTHTVLDLGCGLGRTCRWVAPQVKQYIGIDIIPEMIEKAKKYNSEIKNTIFKINKKHLKLSKFSVDIVYSEIAFQHMSKKTQKSYINDLRDIIKTNGIIYLQLPKSKFYPVGWDEIDIGTLFSDWDYEIINVPKYNTYYMIKAKLLRTN